MVAGPGIGALMFSEAYVWLTDLTDGIISLHKAEHMNLQHVIITTNITNMQTINISPKTILFPSFCHGSITYSNNYYIVFDIVDILCRTELVVQVLGVRRK
ncbi:hypothetical protein FKM82_027510 [Ascaphus truei]